MTITRERGPAEIDALTDGDAVARAELLEAYDTFGRTSETQALKVVISRIRAERRPPSRLKDSPSL